MNYGFAIIQLRIKCNNIKITAPLSLSKIRGFNYPTTRRLSDTDSYPEFFTGERDGPVAIYNLCSA